MDFEILGTIKSAKPSFDSNGREVTKLEIETYKNKEKHLVNTKFMLPYEIDDEIYCVVEQTKKETQATQKETQVDHPDAKIFDMVKHPIVILSQTEESIKKVMYPIFTNKTAKIYNDLIVNRNPEQLFSQLSFLACQVKRDNIVGNPFPFIEDQKYSHFIDFWFKNKVLRQIFLLNITQEEFLNYRTPTGGDFYTDLKENPYLIYTISLEKADAVSDILNKNPEEIDRYCGVIVRKIFEFSKSKGYVGVPVFHIKKLFDFTEEIHSHLLKNYNVVMEYNTFYLKYFYVVEKTLAENLIPRESEFPFIETSAILSDDQKRSVIFSFKNKVSIIVGSAGTGKTTTIKEKVNVLERIGINYLILSFTGKAVSRVKEVTGSNMCLTINRALALKDLIYFDHLIIDEISMVSNNLMYLFFEKYPRHKNGYHITMFGDPNQLPPIDCGDLLGQLCRIVPVFKLTHQHRQECLDLPKVFEKILKKEKLTENTENFTVVEGKLKAVEDLVREYKESGIEEKDMIVITSFNKDVNVLNEKIQKIFRPEDSDFLLDQKRNIKFYIQDKVVMTENNYDFNIFNGDEGIVEKITDCGIKVRFGKQGTGLCTTKTVDFFIEKDQIKKKLLISSLVHSYCITVHRSQGSEWNHVIFFLDYFTNFLSNNILYTALSRARKTIKVVGTFADINRAIGNPIEPRLDNLAIRISDLK